MSKIPMRFLAVAYTVPVQASGTAMVIRRLLENFSADEVVLLARQSGANKKLDTSALHYPIIQIPIPHGNYRGARYGMMASVLPGIIQGLQAIRRHNPQAIVSFFPDEGALLLGYWLHRLTGLPFLPYFCDLYAETNRTGWQRTLATWLQPRVLRAAARLIVVNAGMAEFYRQRYQIQPAMIPTAINTPIPDLLPLPDVSSPLVIGFSGSITSERLDTLQTLVQTIGHNTQYEIRYFTAQTQAQLERMGAWADNARLDFARNTDELLQKLAACDVLYLPLSFEAKKSNVDQLKTCFGIKSYDYFISQRPTLVHCPAGYFTGQFYIDHDCGLVVTTQTPDDLLQALDRLQNEQTLRQRLTTNALEAAHQFEGARVADQMRQVLAEVI